MQSEYILGTVSTKIKLEPSYMKGENNFKVVNEPSLFNDLS